MKPFEKQHKIYADIRQLQEAGVMRSRQPPLIDGYEVRERMGAKMLWFSRL